LNLSTTRREILRDRSLESLRGLLRTIVLASASIDGSKSKLVVDTIKQGDIWFHLRKPCYRGQKWISTSKERQRRKISYSCITDDVESTSSSVNNTEAELTRTGLNREGVGGSANGIIGCGLGECVWNVRHSPRCSFGRTW
jgi:hypothetical protein